MKAQIVNNRRISGWLFPKSAKDGGPQIRAARVADRALRATGRLILSAERAVIVFVGALPVVDVAFVLLVVVYVKAS